jgi:hypothetical protein
MGWIYHDRKNFDKAIGFFKQSIKKDAKLISAYNGLSKTFFKLASLILPASITARLLPITETNPS